MISGGAIEAFGSGHPKITQTAGAAITAGTLVEYTAGRTVGPAANGSAKVAGIAMQTYDGTATTGSKLAVATGGVWYLTAHGAITAGQKVCAYTGGLVRAYVPGTDDASLVVGTAPSAIADGASGLIELRLN